MDRYLNLVKFSHTIFAMPFALIGFFLGTYHQNFIGLSLSTLTLVIICMVTGRNAAMAFNRYIDADFDVKNPRTAIREIPSGIITKKSAITFVVINSLLFIFSSYLINWTCFILSPVALFIILGYSYTKRFTWLCHLVLGLGLSLAPIGAYIAVTGVININIIALGLVVMFWVAGFDIIYALQDEDFDKYNDLHSIPVFLGKRKGLMLSRLFHFLAAVILMLTIYLLHINTSYIHWLSYVGVFIFISMLIYQHSLVKYNDLSKINLAFFTTNGIASIIIGTLIILDITLI